MGIIKFSILGTTNTGSGTPATNIGFGNLTSSNQLIFSKLVEAGNQYTPNQYDLYARISGGSAIVFTPTWSYTDAGNDGPYRVFEPVTGTLNSFCQMYISSGANVASAYPYISGTGSQWTFTSAYIQPTPTYFINPNITSVNEGGTVTYTIATTNVANGTTLYWTNNGTTQATDFVGGNNSGTVVVTADVGTFTRQLVSDVTTEGPESIIIELRTNSISGSIVATSNTVTVNDTSLTPTTYSITQNVTSVNEGSSVIFTVNTTNVSNGTTLYWTTNSTTTSPADFSPALDAGSFTINTNTATITRPVTADLLTEGVESFQLNIRTSSTSGTIVATSAVITINDISFTPPPTPTYTVTPVTTSINEGSNLTFNVLGTNITDGTYYWSINNSTTSNTDFSTLSGSFSITNNAGSFIVTPVADSLTEGSETFSVSIRTSSTNGTVVATSSTVTVNDTSTTPPPPETPPTPVVAMGAVSPAGGYGIGQPYSVAYTTSYASSVSGSVTGVSSTSLSTTGTYSWTNAGYGVRTATITAGGSGGTSTSSASYTVYQPQWSVSPQYPTVDQTFSMTISGGIPYSSYTFTGFDGSSGTLSLNASGSNTFTFSGGLNQVQTIYYDVYLPGTGSALYDVSGRIYTVIHPNETVTASATPVANTPFNIILHGGVPNATFTFTAAGPYPSGSNTFDSTGNRIISGISYSPGSYSVVFTFPAYSPGPYGTTIAQRTRTFSFTV